MRYVYFDVVDFTKSRSIEAQTDILLDLNRIVAEVISGVEGLIDQAILLPTGDGVCICLVNTIRSYDLDIRIALDVLDRLFLLRKEKIDQARQFEVRVGLNENQDNLIVDSRGCPSFSGSTLRSAQMPPSNPAGGRIGNDVVSLPLDSASVRQSKRPTSKTSPSFKLSS